MKKFWILIAMLPMFASVDANAKFQVTPVSRNPAVRLARADMEYCDKDKNGFLTFEEYDIRKNRPMTVNDRKNVKMAKKKGYYKTNEERFKEMDTQGKGKITLEDLESYYTKLREDGEEMF